MTSADEFFDGCIQEYPPICVLGGDSGTSHKTYVNILTKNTINEQVMIISGIMSI